MKEAEEAEETEATPTGNNDVNADESDVAAASCEVVESNDGTLSGGALKAMLAAGRGQQLASASLPSLPL